MKKVIFIIMSAICNDLISSGFLTKSPHLGVLKFEEGRGAFLSAARKEMIAVLELDRFPMYYYDQEGDIVFLIHKKGISKPTYKTILHPFSVSQLGTTEEVDKESRKASLKDYCKSPFFNDDQVMAFIQRLFVEESFFDNEKFNEDQRKVIDDVSTTARMLHTLYERKFKSESSMKVSSAFALPVVAVASVVGLATYLKLRK